MQDAIAEQWSRMPYRDVPMPRAQGRAGATAQERPPRAAKITFEYVMLAGVNDTPAHAQELVALLSNMPAKVNLIPFNSFPQTDFRCSSQDSIDRFREVLLEAGLITITRKTRGGEIDAACGQLVGRIHDRTRRREHMVSVPVNFQ